MTAAGLVIIGSGPAGVSAAEAFREHEPDAPVRIMTADPALPYARPPLSKEFLRGDTDDVDLHPRHWFDERSIEIHRSQVAAIDVGDHVVVVAGQRMPYDALVLACGASPASLPVPGAERALSLRSLEDARRLRAAADDARSAVVVGAGFIGCEAAASLAMRGVDVTLIAPEELPQEKRLGADAGRRLRDLVTKTGARYAGGESIQAIDSDGVRLSNGRVIRCELVLAATGVTPNSDLGRAAGLRIQQARIVVGPDMRTSEADIFAAGDVALAKNTVAGRRLAVEHWQDAIDHGTVAGSNAAGRRSEWDGVPGFWTSIGDATVKYHAWGDGFDASRLVAHDHGFTVWYQRQGATVGVLTLDADDDYALGDQLIRAGKSAPVPSR
jgi:NADPH-dependent 2,4-dienoyl-CoA reductase/sulfur reductase-like enzyme